MRDPFSSRQVGLTSPAQNLFEITPNDTATFPVPCRALNVASSGRVQITTVSGDTAVLFIAAGIPFPVRAVKVWQTGTTAVGIVGLY